MLEFQKWLVAKISESAATKSFSKKSNRISKNRIITLFYQGICHTAVQYKSKSKKVRN